MTNDEFVRLSDGGIWGVLARCGSPIEEKFYLSFLKRMALIPGHLIAVDGHAKPPDGDGEMDCLPVLAQHQALPTLGHKSDFVMFNPRTGKRCVVECDGYEFHRDVETFDKDRDADARMTAESQGALAVFRFSGKRINEHPEACADKVLSYLYRDAAILQRRADTDEVPVESAEERVAREVVDLMHGDAGSDQDVERRINECLEYLESREYHLLARERRGAGADDCLRRRRQGRGLQSRRAVPRG